MTRYFILGPVAGTPLTRYAVLDGHTVTAVQVSVPEGQEVERPAHVRWRLAGPAEVQIRQFRINEVPTPGEQARRTTWSRSGKRAAAQ